MRLLQRSLYANVPLASTAVPTDRDETEKDVVSGMPGRSPVTHVSPVGEALMTAQGTPSISTTASFTEAGRFQPRTATEVPPAAVPYGGYTDVTTGVIELSYEYASARCKVTFPDRENTVIVIS